MALTDTFLKQNTKYSGAPAGDKHTDGGGMYLHVKEAGKYWRMNYRFTGKQKTLALGVYPAVSLAQARQGRDKARKLLAQGIDPNAAKKQGKQATAAAAANTFESVAREWLTKTAADRQTTTQDKIAAWLEKDVIPFIGAMPISTIGPRDVLAALRKMEARGALDSVQRVKQVCGQVFRYAVATGSAERDVTPDLKGAFATAVPKHFAAITEPKQAGELTLPLKNVSLAEWFNSDKENANDENIKGALHARVQARGSTPGGERPKPRSGSQNAGSG